MAQSNWRKNANLSNTLLMQNLCTSVFNSSGTFTGYTCELREVMTIAPDLLEIICTFQNLSISGTVVGNITPQPGGILAMSLPAFATAAATALSSGQPWTFTTLRLAAEQGQYTIVFKADRNAPIGQGKEVGLPRNHIGITGITGTKSQFTVHSVDGNILSGPFGPSGPVAMTGGTGGFTAWYGQQGNTHVAGQTSGAYPGNTAIGAPTIIKSDQTKPFRIISTDPDGDSGLGGGGGIDAAGRA
jgi:hypothetical protein